MWVIKPFEELTAGELHLIYKERTAVFVVEQNCPYQEVDDTDLVSIHFWKQVDNRLLAYARLIPEESGVRIGRVLVPKSERTHGYGQELMQVVLEYAKTHFPDSRSMRKHKPICRLFMLLLDSIPYRKSIWKMISRTST
jgi:ElaA protein